MKTTLPERSLIIKERLEKVTEEILAAAKDKIAMIILFGSYARGDWVSDEYTKGHITYSYQSDLDILVILKGKMGRNQGPNTEDNLLRRLARKGLQDAMSKDPWVTLIVEHISRVNQYLEQGQYFFSDIRKEGVLLYDNGEFQLAEAQKLPWHQRKKVAEKDYKLWFKRGSGFLSTTNFTLQKDELSHSAFELHQATESFYNCILLVFTGYKPKLHDIRKLGSIAGNYNEELWGIFPHSMYDQRQAFRLLEKAYIEARYNDDYRISKEQLLYLIEEVEKLQKLTERICLEYISRETTL